MQISTAIPNVTENKQWEKLTKGAWTYYNNDPTNNTKFGKLYNWYAVSPTTNGNKNVCPTGWHVPKDAEWTALTDYLGGLTMAGSKMKEVGTTSWNSLNNDATNTSLFTGLPGGIRFYESYGGVGEIGRWCSSTEINTNIAWYLELNDDRGYADRASNLKLNGLSVRCLKD